MKLLVTGPAIGTLFALVSAGCDMAGPLAPQAADPALRDPGYSASGARIIETGVDGRPRYAVRAATIRQDPADGSIALQGIEMRVTRTDAEAWLLSAAAATMPESARNVALTGTVRVTGAVAGGRQSLEIRTEQLAYDLESEIARAPGAVTILLGGRRLDAVGMIANLKDQRVQLESKVNGRFTP